MVDQETAPRHPVRPVTQIKCSSVRLQLESRRDRLKKSAQVGRIPLEGLPSKFRFRKQFPHSLPTLVTPVFSSILPFFSSPFPFLLFFVPSFRYNFLSFFFPAAIFLSPFCHRCPLVLTSRRVHHLRPKPMMHIAYSTLFPQNL